ncbi:MAG: 8-amino-7-oxononanoate synthase [Steroidobacteraceae bacterium]
MRRDPALLAEQLAAIDAAARRRVRQIIERCAPGSDQPGSGAGVQLQVGGRTLLNFCSNDYLGLARHPQIAASLRAAATHWGTGSGAAHLVSGHSAEHHALEEELAAFTGRARALLFSTGYMANLGVIDALSGRGEVVVEDALNHASLLDGAQLAGARLRRYEHADAADAARLLQTPQATLLATDGVFSMDGDVAPLPALAGTALAQHSWLLVDDAHGFGVLGAQGAGSASEAGLGAREVPLLMGTLGKACGCFGAFVAGDADVIEYLLQKARTFIFTTALPPALAAATRTALQLVRAGDERRAHLQRLISRFRAAALSAQLPLLPSRTPIQPLLLGDSAAALALSQQLAERGFWVSAIRPPTVPANSARLRITLSAAHSEAQVDALCNVLAELWRHWPRPTAGLA